MQLIGLCTIVRDATVKTTESGRVLAEMALVFNRGKDESTFIDATMWGERAEKLAQHLTKGKQICATLDNVHFKAYTKRDGQPGGTLVATLQSLDFTRGQKQQASESQPQVPKSPMQVIQDMDPDLPF